MSYQEILALEQSKQSSYSPSVVDDEEFVGRALFTPNHIKDGKILPAAFEQIMSPNGMSVLRKGVNFDVSLAEIKKIMIAKQKTYERCVFAHVGSIRSIQCDDNRLICVIDTSRENIIGHADLISTRKVISCSLGKKSLNLYIRRAVARLFNKS